MTVEEIIKLKRWLRSRPKSGEAWKFATFALEYINNLEEQCIVSDVGPIQVSDEIPDYYPTSWPDDTLNERKLLTLRGNAILDVVWKNERDEICFIIKEGKRQQGVWLETWEAEDLAHNLEEAAHFAQKVHLILLDDEL